MKIYLKGFAGVVLCLLYGWTVSLILSPNVTKAYQAHYITHETNDWRPSHYPATPQEGFAFNKPGLPSFVKSTVGISTHEGWGRWTDARLYPSAKILLRKGLQGNVCLTLKSFPAQKQLGKEVHVRIGTEQRSFVPNTSRVSTHSFSFQLRQPRQSIQIVPTSPGMPREWDPKNTDSRKLGLGLVYLSVRQGLCPSGSGQ